MNRNVLVVDDDPALCELMQTVLAGAGMNVEALTDSEQAQLRLSREKFDAIFLDVNMPKVDGIELARRARASGFNQKTPIVMVAGSGDPALQQLCFQAGANFFLYKPFDRQRLLRILRVTQGPIQQERRRFQRVPVKCKVTVESRGESVTGTSLDISLNGILVHAGRAFPAGSPVNITVQLAPGQPELNASGHVARTIGDEFMGIQMTRISSADSERLQDFLLPKILAISGPEPPMVEGVG